MAATLVCSTLSFRLRLAVRFKPAFPMPIDRYREVAQFKYDCTGHFLMHYRNKSGFTKKKKYKSPSSMVLTEPVVCPVTGRFFIRLHVCGDDPPDLLDLVKHCFCDGFHQMRSPKPLLTQMLVHGNIPNLPALSIIIQSYCKQRVYHRVHDAVFTQMKSLELKPNKFFYKTLMDGVCASFGPIVGYKLLKRLSSRYQVQMPLSCYNAIVGQFRKPEIFENMSMAYALIDVLMYMRRHRIIPGEEIINCLLEISVPDDSDTSWDLKKAAGVGRLIVAEGIKTGAVFFPTTL